MGWEKWKINGPLLEVGPPFVNPGVCPGFTLGRGIVTVVNVHPAWGCTSPLGVVPVGSGHGRWRLSRRRQSPKGASLYFLFVGEKLAFFRM